MIGDEPGSSFSPKDLARASALLEGYREKGWRIATAESCTGGLVAALLTEIAGSSTVFDRGLVTYSNEAKIDLLGVEPALLARHGAVSAETAEAMAGGALSRSLADCAVAVTGIAGPGGGTADKPVGLVHFGFARVGRRPVLIERRFTESSRAAIRIAAMRQALGLLETALTPTA